MHKFHNVVILSTVGFGLLDTIKAMEPANMPTREGEISHVIAAPSTDFSAPEKAIDDWYHQKRFQEIIAYAPQLIEHLAPQISITKQIPLSKDTIFMIGDAYMQAGENAVDRKEKMEQGLGLFQRIFQLLGHNVPGIIHAWVGVLEEGLGQPMPFMQFIQAFAKDQSLESYYHTAAAKSYLRIGKYDTALEEYNIALHKLTQEQHGSQNNRQYDTWLLYEGRGLAYFKLNRWKEAITNYLAAINSNSNHKLLTPLNYINLANAYFNERNYQDSLTWFLNALTEIKEQKAIYYFAAAEPAMDLNQWELAAHFFEQGFDVAAKNGDPVTWQNYSNAGYVYMQLGNWEEVAKYLNKAKALQSPLPPHVQQRLDTANAYLRAKG
ncbi:tetratricopeptide repeat protein [Candidatus Odyssella thessalonicensis]|uniref:tetratricopeptide repeat protein n=1 Tax=Candidatus Odyssella thessalonicensis TaxID=84647 RepID=UPI000225B4AE|nr:tetratricopeptide repeat protein [Candidatus Odyssella thessalonicensis]